MVEGRTDHTGLRLLVMTSVFALLAAAWLWGIMALGAHATAAQGSASDGGGGPYERAVVSCPAPREPEEGGVCGRRRGVPRGDAPARGHLAPAGANFGCRVLGS